MPKGKPLILENVLVTGYAAQGKALVKENGKVYFITGAVPGDKADILITKNKKDWGEGIVLKITAPSENNVPPFCKHFGTCGGCKWQMLPYAFQLQYKQQEVEDNLQRIGKIALPAINPIIGCDTTIAYRNKLEFTFSNKRYIPREELNTGNDIIQQNALGYHAPRVFDKVIDISECFLMDDVNNEIRNTIRDYCIQQQYEYYNIKEHTGWLRNIIVRRTAHGEIMVNVCFNYDDEIQRKKLFDYLLLQVPQINTLLFTINPKWNDSIYDLTPQVYHGKGYITERLENFQFIISPKSFFQTNTRQAEKLYSVVRSFAQLSGKETVYDLYCGTGSIGIFCSPLAKKIIGVETIAEAIEDATKNAVLNHVSHASFFSGDVIKVCTHEFFATHGKPDVIITDPPRAGMHEKLVQKLLEIEAPRIVYVSCNVATQARDLALLNAKYEVDNIQPVDMFPHTHHIECVVSMHLR